MKVKIIASLAAGLMLAIVPGISLAQSQAQPDWSALPAPELQKIRGGFEVAGISFDFGATVSTYVGGELALQTTLQWTPAGANVASQGAATPIGVSSAEASAVLRSLGLNPAATTAGVVLKSNDGVTAVVQQLDASRITNLIVNTASNQNIRQDTNLSLTLPGFAATQQGYDQQRLASSLSSTINAALRLSTPR